MTIKYDIQTFIYRLFKEDGMTMSWMWDPNALQGTGEAFTVLHWSKDD